MTPSEGSAQSHFEWENVVVTGSYDESIRILDLRQVRSPRRTTSPSASLTCEAIRFFFWGGVHDESIRILDLRQVRPPPPPLVRCGPSPSSARQV